MRLEPLRTPLCERLGIDVPIHSGGMGNIAYAPLAAAVSAAGGLGVLGTVSLTPEAIRQEIQAIRARTDRPFGVNVWLYPPQRYPAQLEAVLAEQPPVLVLFSPHAGAPDPQVIAAAHERGIFVISLARTVAEAQAQAQVGVDAIIASGGEAGGHRSAATVGTLTLVPQIVDAVGPLPVLAAGGIADGRGLLAALALGAQGAVLGTRFVASQESAAGPGYRERLLAAQAEDTVTTRAYTGEHCRVLRSTWTDEWATRDAEVLPYGEQQRVAGTRLKDGLYGADLASGYMPAGQSVGLVHDLPGAGEIVARVMREALAVRAGLGG